MTHKPITYPQINVLPALRFDCTVHKLCCFVCFFIHKVIDLRKTKKMKFRISVNVPNLIK